VDETGHAQVEIADDPTMMAVQLGMDLPNAGSHIIVDIGEFTVAKGG